MTAASRLVKTKSKAVLLSPGLTLLLTPTHIHTYWSTQITSKKGHELILLNYLAKQMLHSKDMLTTCSPVLTHLPAQASMQ